MSLLDLWMVRHRSVPRRLPASSAYLVGFGGYFVLAALMSIARIGQVGAIALVMAVAGVVGWWTTVPVAAGIAALGWLFYSGFVTHSYGRLGIVGTQDAIVAGLLLAAAVGAAVARIVAARRSRLDAGRRRP